MTGHRGSGHRGLGSLAFEPGKRRLYHRGLEDSMRFCRQCLFAAEIGSDALAPPRPYRGSNIEAPSSSEDDAIRGSIDDCKSDECESENPKSHEPSGR
ncbi:MAG: hypothetical protein ISN28_00665 [Ectothiorhodospiraceae bacterium AqS1]|nr:hypothetical protein [Ectothiorhodospiraceae bacterium AqS1]